jgi:plasmid stabilization system protein ParE
MRERRIRWTETGRGDLEIVVDDIAEDSVENALAVLDGRRDLRSLLLERLVRD